MLVLGQGLMDQRIPWWGRLVTIMRQWGGELKNCHDGVFPLNAR
jgi:hypothetical protein